MTIPGLFITLEGGEGAGKSTQSHLLAEKLQQNNYQTCQTREPGGCPQAELVRDLLVNGEPDRWSSKAEALLNYAARDAHLHATIIPARAAGKVVICDRFMDSTRAYQGAAGNVESDFIDMLETRIVGKNWADLTFIFDLDPQTGLDRTSSRLAGTEDRFERKPLKFHESLREGFLQIASDNPQRCVIIDAEKSVEEIAETIWQETLKRLVA